MKRDAELHDVARATLTSFVSKRIATEQSGQRHRADIVNPYNAMTNFDTLPGMQELKLQRSLADVVGLPNPFFKLHEVRAGARTQIAGRVLDNYSSYDYLGLNGHPEVQAAAQKAIEDFGTSCSASRLVAGERPFHRDLEAALAAHYGQDACITFVSGHATNVGAIGTLLGPKDLVVHDSLAHNSIVLGATLSGAERRAFAHNDLKSLEDILSSSRARYQRVLIVVEGLYSMDGDTPDLTRLVEIKRRHGAWLMVDEAHSLGVLGERGFGLFEEYGVEPSDVDIWMGTLSKTLSGCGGYIAGCTALVEYLKCTSGGFVYSVGMPPPIAAAARAALQILHREPERVAKLRANSRRFTERARALGLNIGTSQGHAVIPIVTNNSLVAVALSHALSERGINAQPIIHPAVPERLARVRFFLTSEHTAAQIDSTVDAIAAATAMIGDGRAVLNPTG